MEKEDRRIYILCQLGLFNAEIASMQAENQHRLHCGNSIAYGEQEFAKVIESYSRTIGHNAVIEYLVEG